MCTVSQFHTQEPSIPVLEVESEKFCDEYEEYFSFFLSMKVLLIQTSSAALERVFHC